MKNHIQQTENSLSRFSFCFCFLNLQLVLHGLHLIYIFFQENLVEFIDAEELKIKEVLLSYDEHRCCLSA